LDRILIIIMINLLGRPKIAIFDENIIFSMSNSMH
jgi:hypothetical protein